jgi:hypothetical protein
LTTGDAPAASGQRDEGLFSALIGNPNVLLSDLMENPNKYEDGVYNLLLDLSSNQKDPKSLSPTDQDLLNRATLDYNAPNRRPPAPVPKPPEPKKVSPKAREIEYHEPVRSPFPGKAPPYWWLK